MIKLEIKELIYTNIDDKSHEIENICILAEDKEEAWNLINKKLEEEYGFAGSFEYCHLKITPLKSAIIEWVVC